MNNLLLPRAVQRKAYGNSKGVGYEVDLWDNVEFGFPVDAYIDRCIGKLVIQAKDARRTEVSVAVLPASITTNTIEPAQPLHVGKALVKFQQGANTEATTERHKPFYGRALADEIFTTKRTVERGRRVAEADTESKAVILC